MNPNGRPLKADLTGRRFGRLFVLGRSNRAWQCRCDCGNRVSLQGSFCLTSGRTTSCGCLLRETIRRPRVHGEKTGSNTTREYRSWGAMKQRCYYAKHKDFHLYGGRGVVVCARWKTSYPNFLQDMGRCPVGMTLERINSDGNYEPSNCRWATAKEQARNRRNTLKPEQVSYVRNSNIPCTALAVELGVSPTTITNIRNGVTWS